MPSRRRPIAEWKRLWGVVGVTRRSQRRRPAARRLHVQSLEQRWAFAVGDLDTSFSSDGNTRVSFDIVGGANVDEAFDVVQQSDGKLIVVGIASGGTSDRGALVRLNADGTRDNSFGDSGKVLSSTFFLSNANFEAVALQSTGKIIVAGYLDVGDDDFLVVRLNPDGTLDTTFNGGVGYSTIPFDLGGAKSDRAKDVLVDPDDKIVVVGSAQYTAGLLGLFGDYDFAVARLNANGTLDTSFSGDGKTTVAFDLGGTKADYAYSVARQSNGKYVVAGSATLDVDGSNRDDMAVVRLNLDGTQDTTFDSDGKQTVSFGPNDDLATEVAVASDGKIVLGGYVYFAGDDADFAVARLLSDGSVDGGFGYHGKTTVAFNLGGDHYDVAQSMRLISGNRIVLAGTVQRDASNFDFGVVRLKTNGTLDTSFSSDGKQVVAIDANGSEEDWANGMLIQSDGKIVVVGRAQFNPDDFDFGIVRLIGNAAPVAVKDRYVLGSTSSINHSTVGVLANDSDADGNFVSAARSASPTKGTLTLRNNGTFDYTPGSSFHGYDTFKYKPFDAYSTGNEVTVEIFSHTGALVAKAYQTVLGRNFDLGGLEYWVQRIDSGEGLSAFATGVFESRERLEPIIKNWYRQYLGRAQDPKQSEIDFYYNRWRNEGGPQNMLPDLFASNEFYQNSGGTNRGWISELYRLIVQRATPPNENEIAFYEGRLTNGASRQSVVRGFLLSPEKLGLIVADLYQRILGRAPTSTEKQTEVDALGAGKTEKQLQLQLLDSNEYRSVPSKPNVGNAVRY